MKIKAVFFAAVSASLIAATPLSAATERTEEPIVIGFSHTFSSSTLQEDRRITIALPEGYRDSDLRYPVVYLLYGDRIPLYFAETMSILHTLGQSGQIPPMILIGVDEKDRYRDWLPQAPDGSATGIDRFIRFVEKELIPLVEARFRCKDFRILVGPQAGANFGLYSLFHSPDLFDGYILTHPFRWRGGRDKVLDMARDRLASSEALHKHLYITYRNYDSLDGEGIPYMNQFIDLVTKNRPEGLTFFTDFLNENTDFISPTGVKEGLKTLFKGYPFPGTLTVGGLGDIRAYYADLSKRMGFDIDIPEHVLAMQSDNLVQKGKIEKALEILHFTEKKYPTSANAVWRLANIYRSRGERAKAIGYYKKCLKLIPNMHPARMRLKELQEKEQKSSNGV
jgi:predicted alpha/beta superfamily hydrolase